MTALGAHFLPHQGYGSFSGKATVQNNALTRLGAHGLPIRPPNIEAPPASVSITLTGAAGLGQAEELEGANVTIRLDGAAAIAVAGTIPEGEVYVGGWGAMSRYRADKQREKDEQERLRRLRSEIRELNKWR